jgi:methylmalonyl-CoA/ethylmalonyl-CoA epimerase
MSEVPHDTLADRAVVQVGLTTRDLDRAKVFYRDVLGLPLLFEAGSMLFFQAGGMRLMVGYSADLPTGGALIYFDAPDILELGPALEAKGVKFVNAPTAVQESADKRLMLREFFDPDGNPLALMGWAPKT